MKFKQHSRPEVKATFNNGEIRIHLGSGIQKQRFSSSLFLPHITTYTHMCAHTIQRETMKHTDPEVFNILQHTALGSALGRDCGAPYMPETNDVGHLGSLLCDCYLFLSGPPPN